jgi:molecular chaperone DnaK
VLDSGNIVLTVNVQSIGGSFESGRNFYSRREGQIDFTKASKRIEDETTRTLERVQEISASVDDVRLDELRDKLTEIAELTQRAGDPEAAKEAMDGIHEAKRVLAQTRKHHLREIRKLELDKETEFFEGAVREHARQSEEAAYDNLARTAQRAVESNSPDFESQLDELRTKSFVILWRQDWFVIDMFKRLSRGSHMFADANEHAELAAIGMEALAANDLDKLRSVVAGLNSMRVGRTNEHELLSAANILHR